MSRAHQDAINHAVGEVNPIKSDLLRQVAELRSAGANRAAESLERIAARLEAWQGRNAR